jgi:hypothetical protein
MGVRQVKITISIFLFISIFISMNNEVFAHGGNTDSYGGHNKTSNGTYHCHSGQCLEDARAEAESECYPTGVSDGLIGKKDQGFVREVTEDLDYDIQEYYFDFCTDAYEEGFYSTYDPPFWEEHLGKIITIGIVAYFVLTYRYYRLPNHRRNSIKEALYTRLETFVLKLFTILKDFFRGLLIVIAWVVIPFLVMGSIYYFSVFLTHLGIEKGMSEGIAFLIGLILIIAGVIFYYLRKLLGDASKKKDLQK